MNKNLEIIKKRAEETLVSGYINRDKANASQRTIIALIEVIKNQTEGFAWVMREVKHDRLEDPIVSHIDFVSSETDELIAKLV